MQPLLPNPLCAGACVLMQPLLCTLQMRLLALQSSVAAYKPLPLPLAHLAEQLGMETEEEVGMPPRVARTRAWGDDSERPDRCAQFRTA